MEPSGHTRRRVLVRVAAGVVGLSVVHTVSACASGRDPAGPVAPTGTPAAAPDDAVVTGGWRRVEFSFVSAYILVRGNEAAVVDLGTDGAATSVEAGLTAAGVGWDAVRHIVVTHRHSDHAGGLAGIAPLVSAPLYAGEADVTAIASTRPLTAVNDGDEVFGLQIIATPGHTPGHVSVFDPSTGVLVAGDALRTTNGLAGPDPRYTADQARAADSVRKLAALSVNAILPGHGAPLTNDAAAALRKLAAALP